MKKNLRLSAPLLSLVFAVSPSWGQTADPESAPQKADAAASPVAAEPNEPPTATPEESRNADVGDKFRALLGRPGGLTSDQAARKAAEYTRDAVVAQAEQQSAKAQKAEVVYQYLPRVTLTAQYTRYSTPESALDFGEGSLVGTTQPPGPLTADDPLFAIDSSAFDFNPLPNNWFLNAGLVVPISDYLLNFSQALTGAEAATHAAELNEQAARLTAAANARLSYYEWVRTRLRVAEAESSMKRAAAQLEDLRHQQEGGRAARADVLRQDAFLASSELNVRRAATREVVARESLHVLMEGGNGVTPQWEIGEDVLEDRPQDKAVLEPVTVLQQEAMQRRLEIRALDETKYALRQRRSVEQTRGYPRVEGFGNLTYANPNPRYVPPTNEWNTSWDVGVRAVWTINDLGSSYATGRVTAAEMEKVEAEKAKLADALRTEVLTAHRSIEEARLATETARRGVAAAEAAYVDRTELFEYGRATQLDVLQAETALITARIDLIDAYVALRQAEVRLDHAIGKDIPADSGVASARRKD